ncbi:MAG: methyltransferase domain-containing protein [Ekhidna sp.]|nr:methyltransferase domain-containing protein [Ekhidna sp.]MBC6410063.1 methyltransferase domain-containing protein [Ekhidna sp.]MBC6427529.1 methyltransferase domain-containing protein [Ekhidna sp.]
MDNTIKKVWEENSNEWIRLVESGLISSRKVTNSAIIKVLLNYSFKRVCDVGCGEGWLVRELIMNNKVANGIDAAQGLIEFAKNRGEGNYSIQTFEDIISGELLKNGPYDAAVLNFCIYEKKSTPDLLRSIAEQLEGNKYIFIQSLHPWVISKFNKPYKDQWLDNSWAGLDGKFVSTHSWYYRTFSGWQKLIRNAELEVVDLVEPLSDSNEPLSIIYVLWKETG